MDPLAAAAEEADQAAALKLAKDAKRPLAGSIGPQTSATMKKVGVPVDFTAKEPGLDALVAASWNRSMPSRVSATTRAASSMLPRTSACSPFAG